MPETKHDGCYFCGSRGEPILKSVVKTVIHKNGREDHMAPVALCSVCIKAPVIDLRAAPQREV
jgi:hypothetical protein